MSRERADPAGRVHRPVPEPPGQPGVDLVLCGSAVLPPEVLPLDSDPGVGHDDRLCETRGYGRPLHALSLRSRTRAASLTGSRMEPALVILPDCGRRLSVVATKLHLTADEVDELSRGLGEPTPDDASITRYGVRIDSEEKLLALIAEHRRRSAAERQSAADR